MNEAEQDLADVLYEAIQHDTNHSNRALQAKEFRVGVSDLGFCSERVRRMLDRQVPYDRDMLPAWIGTALGAAAEQAALRAFPDAVVQAEVSLVLDGESATYQLDGHPDLVEPSGILIDFKSDYGLDTVRRSGPSDQQQFQRHCYAKAAHEAGLFHEDVKLQDVQVANVWIDRAAIERRLHVQMEPFEESWVMQAGMWLDEVVYTYKNDEEAKKEPPREMCAVTCGFFDVCRAYDTDVSGLLTDPQVLMAVEMYQEGQRLEKDGKFLRDQAKQHLRDVEGSTGKTLVRWTWVNESLVPEFTRRGYYKLDVKDIPKGKVRRA